jgi:hypothetical protein
MTGSLALVYPVLAQVFLTFAVYILLGVRRYQALTSRKTRARDVALGGDAWPNEEKKVANNLRNQSEAPVIFYVLCGVATYLGITPFGVTILAWIFVLSRVAHTAVHATSNVLWLRATIFAIGLTVLVLMWIVILLRLLAA